METIVRNCAAVIYAGTYFQPEELCESDAAEGSDYCEGHDPENYDGPEDSYDDQDYWIERDAENDRYDDGDWM